jgi:hypothetical protein
MILLRCNGWFVASKSETNDQPTTKHMLKEAQVSKLLVAMSLSLEQINLHGNDGVFYKYIWF